MTTFTDRENAIEAHHAVLELAAFQERLHAYKALGLRVAARLGLQGSEAQQFAVEFTERLGLHLGSEDFRARVSAELRRHGLQLSPSELRHLILLDHVEAQAPDIASSPRSWIEFLVTQLLMLFGADQSMGHADVAPRGSRLKQSFLYVFRSRRSKA